MPQIDISSFLVALGSFSERCNGCAHIFRHGATGRTADRGRPGVKHRSSPCLAALGLRPSAKKTACSRRGSSGRSTSSPLPSAGIGYARDSDAVTVFPVDQPAHSTVVLRQIAVELIAKSMAVGHRHERVVLRPGATDRAWSAGSASWPPPSPLQRVGTTGRQAGLRKWQNAPAGGAG